jgi:hypothetical protein
LRAPILGASSSWRIDAEPDPVRTLNEMVRLSVAATHDPIIVQYANEIVENVRGRDYAGQIATIHQFLDRYFRFINNPIGVQRIRTPRDMLIDIERKGFVLGACDDAAILAATLGLCNALNAQFRAVGFGSSSSKDDAAPLTHVIADLWDGEKWCPLDVTRPTDIDRLPYIVRTLTVQVH